MKILIFGGDGLLGQEIAHTFSSYKNVHVVPLNHKAADVTNERQVTRMLLRHKPNVVINCAALINVDWCEEHPLEAWQVNTMGPGIIARALQAAGLSKSTFVHISTSDVFGDNKKRFIEKDIPLPVNVYGRSKRGGEQVTEAVATAAAIHYYVIRTSWLYGQYRPTFVDFVVRDLRERKSFAAIGDQYGVVTWSHDVARALYALVAEPKKYASGIYHIVDENSKGLSKFAIALVEAKLLGLPAAGLKKASKKSIFKVPRPTSARLINTKFPKLPMWKDSLKTYLLARYPHE